MKNNHKTKIDALAYGGDAVAHIDNRVVFIPGGVPGDEVLIEITRDKGSFMRGEITELLSPSPDRTEPFCRYAGLCGGCQWQSVKYDAQLRWKRTIVEETFRRIGGFGDIDVEMCLASPIDRGYRTAARYPAKRTKQGIVFGYYGRRTHRIVDIESCPVASDNVNIIAASIRKELNSSAQSLPDITEITIRSSYNRTSSHFSLTVNNASEFPETVLSNLADSDSLAGASVWTSSGRTGRKILSVHGDRHRFELIGGVNFRIDERSFFQINIPQTESLVNLAGEMIDIQPDMVFIDGYGGVGLFSLSCAGKDNEVTLFDTSGTAVKDSIFNAHSAEFSRFRALKAGAADAFGEIGKADVLILDPPRTGLGLETVQAACSCNAETIVYISCNPATLTRDIRLFCDRNYSIERIVPIDMFPNTYHIETMVKLKRN